MGSANPEFKSEIQHWLKVALKEENLKDISVNILGNTEKGDGYLGDIVFVDAVGTTDNGLSKSYSLVLKCSKRSKALRDSIGVQNIFLNEINLLKEIIPSFIEFQKAKGLTDLFDNVPKCHGAFTGEAMEVIVLENLRKLDYELWPKKIPQNKNHIYLNVKKYGQFHATSVAISQQQPEIFQKWVKGLEEFSKRMEKKDFNFDLSFGKAIEESYELLKSELNENKLSKWKALRKQLKYIFTDMLKNENGIKAISHGDSWNNNFMFSYNDNNKDTPAKVAFLDWQMSRYTTPILDLSYYVFSCASPEDLENLSDVLTHYHNSFTEHLEKLHVENPKSVYPFEEFLNDWNIYSKFGLVMSALLMKICATDKEEVEDIKDVTESGRGFEDTFNNEIKDKDTQRRRIKPIVECAIKYNLI